MPIRTFMFLSGFVHFVFLFPQTYNSFKHTYSIYTLTYSYLHTSVFILIHLHSHIHIKISLSQHSETWSDDYTFPNLCTLKYLLLHIHTCMHLHSYPNSLILVCIYILPLQTQCDRYTKMLTPFQNCF